MEQNIKRYAEKIIKKNFSDEGPEMPSVAEKYSRVPQGISNAIYLKLDGKAVPGDTVETPMKKVRRFASIGSAGVCYPLPRYINVFWRLPLIRHLRSVLELLVMFYWRNVFGPGCHVSPSQKEIDFIYDIWSGREFPRDMYIPKGLYK